MPRTKGGVVHGRKRKRVLKEAAGFTGGPGTIYRVALEFTLKAGKYAYRDRRQKKRQLRSLWIVRINAAAHLHGLSYSRLIAGLKAAGSDLDRKVLADIAVRDAEGFGYLAAAAKNALDNAAKKQAAPAEA
jgi:large subunit ribosomal protein L20